MATMTAVLFLGQSSVRAVPGTDPAALGNSASESGAGGPSSEAGGPSEQAVLGAGSSSSAAGTLGPSSSEAGTSTSSSQAGPSSSAAEMIMSTESLTVLGRLESGSSLSPTSGSKRGAAGPLPQRYRETGFRSSSTTGKRPKASSGPFEASSSALAANSPVKASNSPDAINPIEVSALLDSINPFEGRNPFDATCASSSSSKLKTSPKASLRDSPKEIESTGKNRKSILTNAVAVRNAAQTTSPAPQRSSLSHSAGSSYSPLVKRHPKISKHSSPISLAKMMSAQALSQGKGERKRKTPPTPPIGLAFADLIDRHVRVCKPFAQRSAKRQRKTAFYTVPDDVCDVFLTHTPAFWRQVAGLLLMPFSELENPFRQKIQKGSHSNLNRNSKDQNLLYAGLYKSPDCENPRRSDMMIPITQGQNITPNDSLYREIDFRMYKDSNLNSENSENSLSDYEPSTPKILDIIRKNVLPFMRKWTRLEILKMFAEQIGRVELKSDLKSDGGKGDGGTNKGGNDANTIEGKGKDRENNNGKDRENTNTDIRDSIKLGLIKLMDKMIKQGSGDAYTRLNFEEKKKDYTNFVLDIPIEDAKEVEACAKGNQSCCSNGNSGNTSVSNISATSVGRSVNGSADSVSTGQSVSVSEGQPGTPGSSEASSSSANTDSASTESKLSVSLKNLSEILKKNLGATTSAEKREENTGAREEKPEKQPAKPIMRRMWAILRREVVWDDSDDRDVRTTTASAGANNGATVQAVQPHAVQPPLAQPLNNHVNPIPNIDDHPENDDDPEGPEVIDLAEFFVNDGEDLINNGENSETDVESDGELSIDDGPASHNTQPNNNGAAVPQPPSAPTVTVTSAPTTVTPVQTTVTSPPVTVNTRKKKSILTLYYGKDSALNSCCHWDTKEHDEKQNLDHRLETWRLGKIVLEV